MSPASARIASAFAVSELFARLSPAERQHLARQATLRTYSPAAVIVREGDTSMTLYVVISGQVGVEVGQRRVRELGPGGFFGEMGLIDDSPRSASVVALEPTECALLGTWDIRHHGGLALGLLPILVQRLRAHTTQPLTEADLLSSLES